MWLTVQSPSGTTSVVEATKERFLIGRDEACDLVLDDPEASRKHASLNVAPDGSTTITDLKSSNGTRVGGSVIREATPLRGGEEIRIGGTRILASVAKPTSATVVRAGTVSSTSGSSGGALEIREPPPRRRLPVRVVAAVGAVVAAAVVVLVLFLGGVIGGNDDEPQSLAAVVAAARPSVVKVNASDGASGSGWVLDAEEGLIVTAHHVIDDGRRVTVSVTVGDPAEGDEDAPLQERDAEIVGTAPCEDLAVLRTDPSDLRTLPFSTQTRLRQGEQVTALGYPATASSSEDYIQSDGTISDVRTSFSDQDDLRPNIPDLRNLILTNAPASPGNSGGPLVNASGELVGVVDNGSTVNQNQNYAIGVDKVREIVGQLRRGVSIGWAGLGLEFDQDVVGFDGSRAVITSVAPDTPADDAGLVPAYVLLGVAAPEDADLRPVPTMSRYCAFVAGLDRQDPFDVAAVEIAGSLGTGFERIDDQKPIIRGIALK